MTREDLERLLCWLVLQSALLQHQPRHALPWLDEFERQYFERWPVPGVMPVPRVVKPPRIIGATSNTGSPSFDQLPPDHPLRRAFQ